MLNYKPNLTIPIVTVDNDEYTTPTLDSDGRLVVSAKTVKQGANTLLNYDPLNNKYTPINPHTASLDANIKARTFENVLKQQAADKEKQERLFADGKNPKQVNSWIDTLFTPDPFSSLAYLIKDYTIDPLFSKDLTFVQKTTALINNAVINLGESMDYVVGQSALRGGIQGAIEGGLPKAWENIKSAAIGGPEGRPNFEWDDVIDTGNGWVDAGATLLLEIFTDPSNLISFGTKSAIKRIGKEAFSTAILKSADDAGIKLLKNQADELTNAAIKTYLYKSDDLVKALQNSKIGRYADSPEAVAKFFTAMADNSKAMSEAKTLNLLKSVRTGTDALQQNVMRMVGATSGLGLGYYTTKGIIKGVDTASYAVSKINHVLKNVDLNTLTLKNSGEVFEGIVTELNKLSDVVGLSERMSARMLRRATQSFQEVKFAELDKILRKGTKSAKLIQELDAWAIKEGFESVMDMLDKIKYIRSAIPETVLSLYDNLNTAITRKVAGSIKDVVVPVKELLHVDINDPSRDVSVALLQGLRALESTPYIQGILGTDIFKEAYRAAENSAILKNIDTIQPKIDILHAYARTALDTGLDVTADEYNEIKKIVLTLLDDPLLSKISSESDAFLRTSAFRQSMLKNVFEYTDEELKDFLEYTLESIFKWERDIDAYTTMFKDERLTPVAVMQRLYDALDNVESALNHTIHSLGDKTHMRTDKIISTLQNKNSKHIVLDSAKRAIEGSEGALDDVIIQIRNTIDITLEKNELADEVYTSVHQLADLVEDMKLDDYFTREGGLWQILEDWDSHGLSLDNAKELRNRLDSLMDRFRPEDAGRTARVDPLESAKLRDEALAAKNLKKHGPFTDPHDVPGYKFIPYEYGGEDIYPADYHVPYTRNRTKVPRAGSSVLITIANTQEMLTELINSAGDLDALASKEVKDKLAKAVESIIYRTKLSHVQTLDMLLTTPGIPQGFADINSRSGVGDLLDVLNDTADLEDGVDSINFLKGLAKSTEVGNEILSVISGSALPDEWKNALYDTIAGKVRMRISDISNPYAFSNDLLIRSKMFIDNNNSAHMARLNALTNTGDTLEEATTLHKYLFGAVKTNNLGRVHASYWNSVTDVLAKDYHKTFNVTYSAGQTGHKTGDIYELAVVLPNGTSYKFIDLPKLKMFRDTMSEQTARKLYGKSKRQVQEFLDDNLAKYSGQDNVHTFDTTEDFATKVYEFFQGVKDASRNAKLSPRLIGYNTAYDSKNTNTLLHNFNIRNMLSTYISKYHNSHELFSGFESFDAAQYVRMRFEGAIEATDAIANEFDGITKKMAQLLEYANAGTDGYKATLMPDFNNRATKSLRDVRDTIDEALAIIKNNGEATSFNMLTETQYKALVTKFTEQELAGMRNQIAGLLENLGETLLNIRKSNADLGQDLIVMDSLAEFSGEHNIMQILNKFMINQDGVSALAFKTFYNPTIYREWFEGLAENTDPYFIEHSYEIADKLSKQFARVKHPMLIYELGDAEVKHVRGYLASIFAQTSTAKFSAWGQYMLNIKEDTNKIQDYIISKVYYDNIIKTMDEETYVAFFEELVAQTNDGVLAKYIRNAEETIFNNVAARMPGIPVNHSQAVKDSNRILILLEETKSLDTLAKQLDNLEDTLVLQADLRDTYGVNLPTTRIREQLANSARSFVDEINNTLRAYDSTFKAQMESTKSSHIRGEIKQEYTERVSEVLSHLENIANTDAYNRVGTILGLDAEEYVKFLYKNAQGVQIIDLGADIFKSSDSTMEQLLIKFMNTLEEGKAFGLRYVESADKDELYVYLDKSLAPLEQLDKLTKNYTLKPKTLMSYAQDNPFVHTYVEHSKALDIATSGAYSISTHNCMDYRKFEELTKYLPDSVRDNMLQEDYLVKHDMIANKFAQTMLGDYGSGVGNIFPTNSSNLMTNTSNVMKHVYENLRGKDMYKTLFYNQENSLKTWVETTSRLGQLDYADVRQAINNANMVVAEYVDGRVRRVNINTLAKYNRAIDSGAVLLDYHSYTRSIEVLNDNQISSTLIKTLNKPLRWIKVGQLMSAGWVARNIPDSTIKGWVQAGMDPMYMTAMFTRTQQHVNAYHRVYAEMFKKYDGVINAKNITDYFDTVKDIAIPKDLFNKMLTFYSNSASSPTSKQLELYNDIAGTLYKRVKGTNGLRESDVRKTLDIFKKFPTYAEAKAQLNIEYPRELADVLLNLRKYIPDQEIGSDFFDKVLNAKFLPPHLILKTNNAFESFIRMHTFLYHTEYTNGSVAEAIKMVDLSQFNRSRDTKGMKILEMLFPFSSFQLDNAMFWSEALAGNKHSVAALAEDVISSMHSSTDASSEELSRNMSLDYLFMSGNLILNQDDGMTLKVNDSLHGVLQLLSNPIGSFAEMFNLPIEVTKTLITAINADPEAYKEDSYNNPKPLSEWDPKDWTEEMLQLIPLVGVVYQRYNTAWGRRSYSDAIMPLIFPSVFGVVKTDAAGTTYQSRPVGYDWYNQSQEYKDTHRFVYGVSYVPSWMKSDPKTYADTLTRLVQMGYDREDAVDMMQTGWYMKAPDYLLKQFLEFDNGIRVYRSPSEGITSQQYPDGSWNYRNTIKGTHYGQDAQGNWKGSNNKLRAYRQRQAGPRKNVKSFKLRFNEPINYSSDRYNYDDWKYYRYKKPRRVYRPTIYSNLFTRNGSSRLAMVKYRGANRSSRQVLRDRSISSRIRTQRIIHQVRGW